MIAGSALLAVVLIALWVYCIFDCVRTEESQVQNLPKTVWLLIVVLVPTLGSIAWLLFGRPVPTTLQLTSGPRRYRPSRRTEPPPPPEPPIDSAEFQRKREEALRRYHEERERQLREQEADVRRREEELRRREQGGSS